MKLTKQQIIADLVVNFCRFHAPSLIAGIYPSKASVEGVFGWGLGWGLGSRHGSGSHFSPGEHFIAAEVPQRVGVDPSGGAARRPQQP